MTALAAIILAAAVCGMGDRPGPEGLVDNGGFILSGSGDKIVSLNPDEKFIPASIAKIITALAALETLGPDYRFETLFFLDRDHNLYIKGSGDPFLVSEEVRIIAAELKASGVKKVASINLDDSIFTRAGETSWNGGSLNPYDAANSGLAVNFNTIFIERKGDIITSAEEQTPTIPLMVDLGAGIPSGRPERINITAAAPDLSSAYVAQLFAAIMKQEGIVTGSDWRRKSPPAGISPLLVHRSSRTLAEVVAPMLRYSNNFIANQLFLCLGAKRSGNPGDWEKGRAFMRDFLAARGINKYGVDLFEGSGLSRKNRVSCRTMIMVLELFKPYADLFPEKDGILIKSGTMTGVYAYAGYIPRKTGLAPFVIILNQKDNRRDRIFARLRVAAETMRP